MENTDRDLILKVLKNNFELRKLYDEHINLEDKLSSFQRRPFLTSEEELIEKEMKLRKLKGVDRMMNIISPHRIHTSARAA